MLKFILFSVNLLIGCCSLNRFIPICYYEQYNAYNGIVQNWCKVMLISQRISLLHR